MIKMPCLFVREFHGRDSFTMMNVVTEGCEWVLAGEGVPSWKRDGTACLWKDLALWKRYDAKKDRKTGEYKAPPAGSFPCSDPDPITGHWPHWAPLGPHDYWHKEAADAQEFLLIEGQTYELCGPKLQGNPERFDRHVLIAHGEERLDGVPRTFDGLRWFFEDNPIEGVVFAHPDGRYAKIRRADYGMPWPAAPQGNAREAK